MQAGGVAGVILAGGEHHQPLVGVERHLGEEPFGQIAAIIRQRPALEVDLLFATVVQLDPVAIHALVILDRGGAQFADHHVARGVLGIDLHRPRLAVEPVRRAVEVGDVGIVRPRQLHLAKQDRFEIKQVRPGTDPGD